MPDIFIPTLRSFTNMNSFSGSSGMLRFYLIPEGEQITVKTWHGQFCIEKSVVEEETSFPMTEDGLRQIKEYLISKI